jgi:3-oxoacyl-[acyl-carrier protein] reductase
MTQTEGRVALVTGGSRGIGRACAIALARDGCDVAVNYRRESEAAEQCVAEIETLGRRAVSYRASVDSSDDDDALVAAVLGDFGHVDVLIHAAGIASRGNSVVDTDPSELDRVMRTNTLSAYFLCRLLVPQMRRRERSDIVFVSSVAARMLAANGSPYNMAKSALEALAITLAKEERRNGIHVNVVAPGLVVTEMGRRLVKAAMGVEDIATLDASAPFGRVCRPEDVASVVSFLCSESAGYMTGQVLSVDGGA